MPPRRSKTKQTEDDAADQTPVRRSTRTRRSVVQEEYDELEVEPPKKRARSARASASAAINYEEENSSEPLKDLKNEELPTDLEHDEPKTPVKRGRGRKISEHKDTPHPKNVSSERTGSRGRKRRETSEPIAVVNEEVEAESEGSNAAKKSKLDSRDSGEEGTPKIDVTEDDPTQEHCLDQTLDTNHHAPHEALEDDAKLEQKISTKSLEDRTPGSVTNGDRPSSNVKQPTGNYEGNIGDAKKDLTVASLVFGSDTTRSSLERLDDPDVVAVQKSTSAAANVAETCGFKVFGDGPTRLLVRGVARIEVKEPKESHSLILLALDQLDQVTSETNRKRVEEYLTAHCVPTDEFSVWTLVVDGKVITIVNVQLESKNHAVSSLLIGCLMRKLDSRPQAFILTGYMPHVRPGTPAYELLRDGYFGNHSIETLQKMRDIKMDDEEERNRGLIDFFWKAYQHSRPWMRSVYETVLNGESVVSVTGKAVIWHSTRGVEAVRVLNHARIVKADLAIRSEA